jgi:hypothetical protein
MGFECFHQLIVPILILREVGDQVIVQYVSTVGTYTIGIVCSANFADFRTNLRIVIAELIT